MTFGEMPTFEEFEKQFGEKVGELYDWELKGEDAKTAERVGLDYAPFNAQELYNVVEQLTAAFQEGDDKAGDLASNIMTTLGYEWI